MSRCQARAGECYRSVAMSSLRAALVIGLLSAACGANPPLAPASTAIDNLSLTPGDYPFFATSLNPPASCGQPAFDVSMTSRVTLKREGVDWVARSTSAADGDLELRFHDTGGLILAGYVTIAGTLGGTAQHMNNAISSTKLAATFDQHGDAVVFAGYARDTGATVVWPAR